MVDVTMIFFLSLSTMEGMLLRFGVVRGRWLRTFLSSLPRVPFLEAVRILSARCQDIKRQTRKSHADRSYNIGSMVPAGLRLRGVWFDGPGQKTHAKFLSGHSDRRDRLQSRDKTYKFNWSRQYLSFSAVALVMPLYGWMRQAMPSRSRGFDI